MKNLAHHITVVVILMNSCNSDVMAQAGVYIPKDAKIFFAGDSATIFADVVNQGKLGIGKNAVVNFTGKKWENAAQSSITDESNGGEGVTGVGGIVRFLSTDSVPQQLNGGYNAATRSGAAFSTLQIQSKGGVVLEGSNAKVRHELKLSEGLVYVKDNILTIGDGNPGSITGFDSSRYIVTDSKVNEGYLLRESITKKDGLVVFPVGTSKNAYTPAAISTTADLADNYYVNVRDGVKREVFGPERIADGVKKTWQIGKQLRPKQDEVKVVLEHLNNDEGTEFTANRASAYVSQFDLKLWDGGHTQSVPVSGALTTGAELVNSGDNSRTFNGTISSASFFTKLTGKGDTSKAKSNLWFNGYRLDEKLVRVYWKTNPEVGNRHFIVQRRLSNEVDFKNIDTILTKAANGNSFTELNYELKDANNYQGITYYRLVMVANDNTSAYSNTIAIAGIAGKHKLLLWPNPTPNRFFIGLNGEVDVKTIIIWNVTGQKMYQQEVNGRSIIEVHGFIAGTYMVGFISTNGSIIETKKVVVLGY